MSIAFKPSSRFLATPTENASREAALPSFPRQVMNAARAVTRTVRSVATGNRLKVSPETAAKREVICKSNDCGLFRESDQRCAACGCPMSRRGFIPDKTQILAESCPKKLWLAGEMK